MLGGHSLLVFGWVHHMETAMSNYGSPLEPWEIELIRQERRAKVDEQLQKLAAPKKKRISWEDIVIMIFLPPLVLFVIYGWLG